MVRRAATLLDSDLDGLNAHVVARLREVHGAPRDALRWLDQQPPIERRSLIDSMRAARSGGTDTPVEWRHTSGSTGTPFEFAKDLEMTAWMDAAMWAAYGWHGIRPGDRQARFWGVPLDRAGRLKRRMLDTILARRRLGAFEISEEQSERFFHRTRSFSAKYAYGYPTLMHQFADHCRARGLDGRDLRFHVVISTGELLSPVVRASLGEFFQCPIVNEYGCTESGVLAFECEAGTSHVIPVAALPQVVREDGETTSGSTGEVVVTDLFGSFMPLLRYRLHDRAAMSSEKPCRCGRSLAEIDVTQGRRDSFILTPHRGPVYDAVLAYTIPEAVQRFRAFQRRLDHLEVFLVPGPGFTAETADECRRRWEQALGPGMSVTTTIVDDLPYSASGKLQYFVPLATPDATETRA